MVTAIPSVEHKNRKQEFAEIVSQFVFVITIVQDPQPPVVVVVVVVVVVYYCCFDFLL